MRLYTPDRRRSGAAPTPAPATGVTALARRPRAVGWCGGGLRTQCRGRRTTPTACGPSSTRPCCPPRRSTRRGGRSGAGTTAEHELPPIVEDLKAEARAPGPVEPVPARRLGPVQPRVRAGRRGVGLVAGHRPRGDQLPGAGHRQHGDPAPVRHPRAEAELARAAARRRDPLRVRDDGARGRLLGRHQHHHLDPPRGGDEYVITGKKWWISGASDPRCQIFIVMGKTDVDAPTHRQQSMVLVPRDTPGLTISRALPVFGYQDQHGHCEIELNEVRVPVDEPARRGGRRLRHRPGPPRPRPHPPLHAPDRHGRARRGRHGPAGARARRVRQAAVRAGRRARADRREPHRDRAGPPARAQDRLDDRQRRLARARPPRSPPSR